MLTFQQDMNTIVALCELYPFVEHYTTQIPPVLSNAPPPLGEHPPPSLSQNRLLKMHPSLPVQFYMAHLFPLLTIQVTPCFSN